jgi:hypothetical protein
MRGATNVTHFLFPLLALSVVSLQRRDTSALGEIADVM